MIKPEELFSIQSILFICETKFQGGGKPEPKGGECSPPPPLERNPDWLCYNDAVSWLNEAKTRIFQPTANFENSEIYLYFVCQPACHKTRCRAPEISHDKGNGGGFTKMLFQRRFTHCAMVIPFILLSPTLFFFIPLARCESHL